MTEGEKLLKVQVLELQVSVLKLEKELEVTRRDLKFCVSENNRLENQLYRTDKD